MRFSRGQVAENQRGAFIGREAARESDGQRFRIQHFLQAPDFRRGRVALHRAGRGALAHEGDQAALAAAMRFPQLRVGNLGDLGPRISASACASRQSGCRY